MMVHPPHLACTVLLGACCYFLEALGCLAWRENVQVTVPHPPGGELWGVQGVVVPTIHPSIILEATYPKK